jgi:YegS/Rv2252/BmrU family lipid kinase
MMTSPFGPMAVIVNPASGRGKVGAHLSAVETALRDNDLTYRIVQTSGPGDAIRSVREALEAGDRFVVAVGGDGTVHEVVNGMMKDGRAVAEDAVLGVIAAGSGCDFVKTFGLPGDAVLATAHLGGANTMPIDVGKVTYTQQGGGRAERYFPNIAEVGLGGAVVARAERLPRFLGPSRYFFSFWLTLPGFKRTRLRVVAGAKKVFEGSAHNVVVANCQYYGGGMKISPRSWPTDGVLDALVFKGPKSDSFTILPKVYRGEHLPHPNIVEFRSRTVHVEAERPLRIEADGEILGWTPATFEVIPHSLTLKV